MMKVTETQLRKIIRESIENMFNTQKEGRMGNVEDLILYADNDRAVYDRISMVANALKKKADKGMEISMSKLVNSSVMRKITQFAIGNYNKEFDEIYTFTPSEKLSLRTHLSEHIMDMLDEMELYK